MKIDRIHVDGYGRFADQEIGPLGSGLSVIIGPNEVGKSTLLDFVRGVLFGLADRRSPRGFHEPLKGGRHGGTVHLRDESDGIWTLSRHLPGNKAVLTAPDGEAGDESMLAALLGRADQRLFGSIFAFGLDELSNFDSLNADQVRDLIFSAGVLGAGRSATAALKALDDQRDQLIRKRSQTQSTQLLARRDEIRARLRDAHVNASSYVQLTHAAHDLDDQIQLARSEIADLTRRDRELDRLQACWAQWERSRQAAAELAARGPIPPEFTELATQRSEINSVVLALSGHQRLRRDDIAERSSLAALEDKVGDLLPRIGINEHTCYSARVDVSLIEGADELALRHQEATTTSSIREGQLDEARAIHATSLRDLTQLRAEVRQHGGARESVELTRLAAAVPVLRGMTGSLAQADARLREEDHERRLAELSTQSRHGPLLGIMVVVAAVLLLCVAVVSAFGLARHVGTVTDTVTIVGVLAAAVVAVGVRRSLHPREAEVTGPTARDERTAHRASIAERISVAARDLGLPNQPEEPEIAALAERLEIERDRRRELDHEVAIEEGAARNLRNAEAAVQDVAHAIALIEHEAGSLATSVGLRSSLSPAQLCSTLSLVVETQDRLRAIARLRKAIDARAPELGGYIRRVQQLAARCGMGELARGDDDALVVAVRTLADRLEAVDRDRAEREALAAQIEVGADFVATAIGGLSLEPDEVQRIRAELDRESPETWQPEQRELAVAIADCEQRLDGLRKSEVEAAHELSQLVGSKEIAELELELGSVEADLASVLEQWATFALSGQLLRGTLARYEAERQPVVISMAAELFARVTKGAYVQLIAREDGPSSGHVEAVTDAGLRVDAANLSRGTAEQLYLCLRLSYAANFAERAGALPLILDDVLVNFDPERAAAMAEVIAHVAKRHQIMVFTCHPHLLDCFTRAANDAVVVELARA